MEDEKSLLDMAVELDEMERDVKSDESDLLEEVLPILKAGKRLKPKDEKRLREMHKKYLGEKDDEEEDAKAGGDPTEGEEEVGDDDFI